MPIDLVIFDCDGVLVDSEPITTATWIEALGELGLVWEPAFVESAFRGGRMSDIVAAAERDLGAPVPEDFVRRFRARLFGRLGRDVRPIPGIHEALDRLTVRTCVASNGPREKMDATLGATRLQARFEGRIFSAYEVGGFKPEPGLFLHAAAAMAVPPARCLVVEDSDSGVLAAQAAGMAVLAYDPEGRALHRSDAPRLRDMRDLPDHVERENRERP